MTIIASLEAAALVAIVYLLLRYQRQQEDAHVAERRELLNRISHPELIVSPEPTVPFVFEPEEPDEIGLVGSIAEPQEQASPS